MKKVVVILLLTIVAVGFVSTLGGCKSKEERERARQRKEDSLYVERQIEHLEGIPDDQIENTIALCDQYGWSDSVLVSEKAKRAVKDGTIEKQVIGGYILDIYTFAFRNFEGSERSEKVRSYLKKKEWSDSIIRYEIDKISQEHGFTGKQFIAEAYKLDREIISEIGARLGTLDVEVIKPRQYQKVDELDRNYIPPGYLSKEEVNRTLGLLMLEVVEEVCRDSGYIPSDFQERLETAKKYL